MLTAIRASTTSASGLLSGYSATAVVRTEEAGAASQEVADSAEEVAADSVDSEGVASVEVVPEDRGNGI